MNDAKLKVLVNRKGGSAASAGEGLHDSLMAAFAKAGVDADIEMLDGTDLGEAVRNAARRGRVVVAGGDGTAACAAQALSGSDTELALLPLGTLNHLARDLHIPSDLEEAAKLAAHGHAEPIDVATVNGHRFVNNASIGLYPFMVKQRDAYQKARRIPKWMAAIPAIWGALARVRHHRLRIDLGSGEKPLVTPLLLVGNNIYSLDAGEIGSRSSLQDGKLSVYAIAHRTRLSLIWFALRAIIGKIDRSVDFLALGECSEIMIHAPGGSVEIALDGEIRRLKSPLKFAIEPRALSIVSPPAEPDDQP